MSTTNTDVFKAAHDGEKPKSESAGSMPTSTRRTSLTKHEANPPPPNSSHEVRWRAAWAGEKNKTDLWVAEPIESKKRLLA